MSLRYAPPVARPGAFLFAHRPCSVYTLVMTTTKPAIFRLRSDDLALLDALAQRVPEQTRTAALRRAIRHYAAAFGIADPSEPPGPEKKMGKPKKSP